MIAITYYKDGKVNAQILGENFESGKKMVSSVAFDHGLSVDENHHVAFKKLLKQLSQWSIFNTGLYYYSGYEKGNIYMFIKKYKNIIIRQSDYCHGQEHYSIYLLGKRRNKNV